MNDAPTTTNNSVSAGQKELLSWGGVLSREGYPSYRGYWRWTAGWLSQVLRTTSRGKLEVTLHGSETLDLFTFIIDRSNYKLSAD